MIPDENEASIVQEIFALAAQGIRAPAIAKSLNAKGLVRRNGKPWTQRQVNAVLIGRELYQEGAIRYGAIEGRSPGLILVRR